MLVDVNGSVSKLSIAEWEDLGEEGGKLPDCLVLVYSIDDQKSFGKQMFILSWYKIFKFTQQNTFTSLKL